MILLDDNTRNLYPIIKYYIYSQAGVASKCILHDEKTRPYINKFSMSYYSSILNQMVVKAQGELFGIKFCEELSKELNMIIGIEFSRAKDKIKYIILKTEIFELELFFEGSDVSYRKDYKPKLTILNVNKKANLKFYQKIESNYKSFPIGYYIDD